MRDCYLRESSSQSAGALSRQEAPFWADARGAPLVRRGFSLRTPPLGRLDAGARMQVRACTPAPCGDQGLPRMNALALA
jgi:hypothetical protein